MERACLTYAASLLLLIFWIVILVLYTAYAPRSVVLGFVFGAGLTSAIAWLCFKYPGLLAMANSRSVESRVAGTALRAIVEASSDPRSTALIIGRLGGWLLTIVFGAASLLFATFAIALRLRGEMTSGMVGAAVLCGTLSVLALITYKFIARAGLA